MKKIRKVDMGGEIKSLAFDGTDVVTVGDIKERLPGMVILVNGQVEDDDRVVDSEDELEANPPAKTGAAL
jgi:hypothetical protein